MPAILTEQLTKHFPPDIKAVDGIDLSIAEGKIFAFLGQNGSGKTTTVRTLTTLLRPTSGRAQVDGLDVLARAAEVRRRIGVALQEAALDDMQTGRELLVLQARLYGVPTSEINERVGGLLKIVELDDAADRGRSSNEFQRAGSGRHAGRRRAGQRQGVRHVRSRGLY